MNDFKSLWRVLIILESLCRSLAVNAVFETLKPIPRVLAVMLFVTCSRTLAVSNGKVTRSATQPAVPAEKTLTTAVGPKSAADPPAMFKTVKDQRSL